MEAGYVRIEPIVYEDFLPVSAAGIFRSNLVEEGRNKFAERATRKAFEEALGAAVVDELALYTDTEATSRAASLKALGLSDEPDANAVL